MREHLGVLCLLLWGIDELAHLLLDVISGSAQPNCARHKPAPFFCTVFGHRFSGESEFSVALLMRDAQGWHYLGFQKRMFWATCLENVGWRCTARVISLCLLGGRYVDRFLMGFCFQ